MILPPGVGGGDRPPEDWPKDQPAPPWGYPSVNAAFRKAAGCSPFPAKCPREGWPRIPPKGWPDVPPPTWPGMSEYEIPRSENINHIPSQPGEHERDEDWTGESEIENGHGSIEYEGNFTTEETSEQNERDWEEFGVIRRVELRIYVKNLEDTCIVQHKLEQAVLDGELDHELEHWGIDRFAAGLLEEPRGYDKNHECACNCRHECGALPLVPCSPEIEVDGEFVGPSYWRAHLHQVTFFFQERDQRTKVELEQGIANVAYTTDGSQPDCVHGNVYQWDTPITLYNTTTITAGICAAGKFSKDLKHATLVVVTPRLHQHYPVYWLSRDRHCVSIDAPLSAFFNAPNEMRLTLAQGSSLSGNAQETSHRYDFIQHKAADKDGVEGVTACSTTPWPEDVLYGWASSNVEVDSRHDEGAVAEAKVGAQEIDSAPFSPTSPWSARMMPGVVVDRNPTEGLRPGRKTREHGRWAFGGGEYERENGLFHQWRVVWRSYDGSRIRIEAPPNTFQKEGNDQSEAKELTQKGQILNLIPVKIEDRAGKWHNLVYKRAKDVGEDADGPKGIELVGEEGEFPYTIMWGWAQQNLPPEAREDQDHLEPLEKAGVNVRAGLNIGGLEPSDRRVAVQGSQDSSDREKPGDRFVPGLTLEMKVRLPMTVTELAAKQVQFVRAVSASLNVKLGAVTLVQIEEKGGGVEVTTEVGAKDEAAGVRLQHAWNLKVFNAELQREGLPEASKASDLRTESPRGFQEEPEPGQSAPHNPTVSKSVDRIIEEAAHSALRADKARKQSEAVAERLQVKVRALAKRLRAVEKEKKRLQQSPQDAEVAEQESWFKRVAGGRETGSEWPAVSEEERMARAAEIRDSQSRPRRIPIGANGPEPRDVEIDVTMPYTMDQFMAADMQQSFKKAASSAASTVPENVDIVSIKAARRRNSGVVIKTKILVKDAAAVNTMKATLGSGNDLKTKFDTALKKQGLKESTGVTAPVTGTSPYAVGVPAGQEAYSERHSSVRAMGPKYVVLSVSRDGTQVRAAAPNDGSCAVGPSRIEVETADGGEALFPYQQVTAVTAEYGERSETVGSGLVFTAPAGGQYPLNAAYVMCVDDPAHLPIVWRDAAGSAIKVLAPNDGTFSPGAGAVWIKRGGGEEDCYAYSSVRAEPASEQTGPGGLLLTAPNGTVYPRQGAFAGPCDRATLLRKASACEVVWRSEDGSRLKAAGCDPHAFNLGPSRFQVRLKGGGVTEAPYDSVSLSPADSRGAAGLLFTAPPEVVYPDQAELVSPADFPEPYPVFGRSSDGQTIYVQAPNDGTFEPGPSKLRLRLSNAQVFTFPYSFISWYPPRRGLPGGLAVTAPRRVYYPDTAAYAGPMDGVSTSRGDEYRVHNERWPERPPHQRACEPASRPVKIAVVEALSVKLYSVARLCEGEAVYSDEPGLVFRSVLAALKGQAFVRGADSDVAAESSSFLSLQLPSPSNLFLLWDERGLPRRGGQLPAWVDGAYVDTGAVMLLSGAAMGVLRSRMPQSGPVYLGGARARPGAGAVHNYVVVVTKAGARSSRSEVESKEAGVRTWMRTPVPVGALDLQVLVSCPEELFVGTASGSQVAQEFPDGGQGYFRIAETGDVKAEDASVCGRESKGARVAKGEVEEEGMDGRRRPTGSRLHNVSSWFKRTGCVGSRRCNATATETTETKGAHGGEREAVAQIGQVLAYGEISVIAPGSMGFPGVIIRSLGTNTFPAGIKSVRPTVYRVAAVRSDGTQLQVNAPEDGWFAAGPATLMLVLEDGSRSSVVYESVGSLGGNGEGGLIFSALEGEVFPQAAAWATPGGAAQAPARPGEPNPPLSSFPRKDRAFEDMYPVSWLSTKRDEVRIECPYYAFEPGPGKVVVRSKSQRGMLQPQTTVVEYRSAARVVADDVGPAGIIFSAARLQRFPEDAAMVSPVIFAVAGVRQDGTQLQALTTLSSFPPGPASMRLVHADGRSTTYPYQSAVELPSRWGVLLSAPQGFDYPHDAAFVGALAVDSAVTEENAQGVAVPEEEGEREPRGEKEVHATPWLDTHPTGALVVSEAQVSSGREVVVSVAVPGAALYTDRVAVLVDIPAALYGSPLVTLADDDRNSKEVEFVRLQASRACYVYILRDPRGTVAQGGKLPLWLSTSFVQTKEVVRTSMPGMQVLSVYRSKAPLWGPIVLGGNDAFPSHGARENFVIVLKAARMENVFHAPADVSSSWPPQPCSWCKSCCDHAPSRDDVISSATGAAASRTSAGAGAAGETAAHTAAAGRGVEGQTPQDATPPKVAVDDDFLQRLVQECDGSTAATECLEYMHACMAPYKMGDIGSCHCFANQWGGGYSRYHQRDPCSSRCRLAVYAAYNEEVEAATGFSMGCGPGQ